MVMLMRAQRSPLKSLKVSYDVVELLYFRGIGEILCTSKVLWGKDLVKLEGYQENFKVTLLERPPDKSCSTSILQKISL